MGDTTAVLVNLVRAARLTAVVDVGANPVDGDPPYKAMLQRGLCTLTGFEPQPAAFDRLTHEAGPLERYLPYAIGDGTARTLHIAAASGMTSLLEPDPKGVAMFNGFSEWGKVTQRLTVQTRRLDDVTEIDRLDLLKIDVQGAELMVFGHGVEKLRKAVAVQTEVSFVPLYQNQPPFGEVDLELRRQGFIPHAMPALKRWPIAPVVYGGDFRRPNQQLLEADVVYVRDFTHPERMTNEQLTQLALVADAVYGSTDLTHRCLLTLVERGSLSSTAPAEYLASV